MNKFDGIIFLDKLPVTTAQGTIELVQKELLRFNPRLEPFTSACPIRRAHLSILMLYLPTCDMVQGEHASPWDTSHSRWSSLCEVLMLHARETGLGGRDPPSPQS